MTVNYTTNLALGQPVTGTESGTWGDDVNNAVTSYLDIAIAGGLAITVTTADVTLTLTQGTSSATNIGSTTAQYAILNVSGAMTAARNLILPSSSRQYVINNACTGGFLLTVKGSATTGVTLVNGEKAHVFWNGSDYAKVSNSQGGAGTFSSITNTGLTSGRVVYSTTGGLETDSANLTFDGTNLTLAGGTANGVTYLNGSKVLTSGSALTYSGSTLSVSNGTQTAVISPRATASGGLAVGTDIASSGHVLNLAGDLNGGGTGGGVNISYYSTVSTVWSAALQIRNTASTYSDLLLMPSGGNVGIGTSSPTTRLTISGTETINTATDATAGLIVKTFGTSGGIQPIANFQRSDAAINMQIGYNGANGDSFFGTTTNHNLYFISNNTERMRIDSSGNVGIGTNAPVAKLDVTGTQRIAKFGAGYEAAMLSFSTITETGAIYRIGMAAGGVLAIGRSDTTTTNITLDTSGNVGIGTNSPTRRLSVENTASGSPLIEITGSAGAGFELGFGVDTTGGFIQQTGAKPLQFFVNSSERMRIDSSGNVGIGVVPSAWGSAAKALQIGAFSAFYQNISGYPEMSFNSYETTTGVYKYQVSGNTASLYSQSGAYHRWYIAPSGTAGNTIGYTQAMTLDASGNLGVGETSPGSYSKFVVRGGSGNFISYFGASTQTILGDNGGDKGQAGTISNHPFIFITNSTERARIDSSGNLGVGTNSPYQKLTVQGGRVGGTTTDFVSGTTGTAYSWGLGASTGNTYANFGCGTSGDTVYANAAIFADGGYAQGMLWLGYTSSNGNYKLQVNGQIFATSATIATSDGRYKENVNSISGALDMVCALNPVTFTWKQNVGGIENPDYDGTLKTEKWLRQPHDFGGGTQIGFIAQEVRQALENQPFINNLIKTNVRDAIKDSEGNVIHPEEEFLGIAEGNMIALLTKAIQEQQALITSLTARITALEST